MATEVIKIIDPDMGSGYDYDSLFDWEAAQQGDLTGARDEIAVAKCRCTGGTADTTAVTVNGWTTSATQYIKIWTDTSESYRHAGKYTIGNKYRLEASNTILMTLSDPNILVDGLQLYLTGSNNQNYGGFYFRNCTGNVKITNCIIRGCSANYLYNDGIQIYTSNSGNFYFVNCIIYDFSDGGSSGGITVWDAMDNVYVYNCSIHNCISGILRTAGTVTAKNCLTASCVNGFYGTITTSYCASSIADGLVGTGDRNSQTFSFVDVNGDDFHLASNDTGALGYGTNLYNDANYPFQTDIDGDDRGGSGASWDIGADEYVAAGKSYGTVWGYQTPTNMTGEAWSTWKTSAGDAAIVYGDASWGKLNLTTTNHYGPVKDTGNSRGKCFVLKRDSIGTGLGTVNLFIRGSTTSFLASDGTPSWEAYSAPVNRVWRYVQAKAEKV